MTHGLTRIWTSLAFAAVLALAVVWLGGANPTQAAGGGVSMAIDATVSPGGDATVDLVATPDACVPEVVPDSDPPIPGFKDCLASWVVKVEVTNTSTGLPDTSVVSVKDDVLFVDDPLDPNDQDPGDVCPPMPTPAGAMVASACLVDTRETAPFDTVTALGVFLIVDTGEGLETQSTLAAMKFHAEGAVGACANLKITVVSSIDPNGHNLSPTPSHGKICITEGTQRVWGDVDCSGGAANVIDGRKIVVKSFGGSPAKVDPTCPSIGDSVSVEGTQRTWGDVDCSGGAANVIDGRKIVVKSFGGSPAKVDPTCPSIGDSVAVQ